jgi:hypothetical protein
MAVVVQLEVVEWAAGLGSVEGELYHCYVNESMAAVVVSRQPSETRREK